MTMKYSNEASHHTYKAMHVKKLLSGLLILSLICVSPVLFAQTGPEDPSIDDPAVPVDGGLSLLLAAGAAYGAGRLRHRKEGKGEWKD
jgi:hypothetical protein